MANLIKFEVGDIINRPEYNRSGIKHKLITYVGETTYTYIYKGRPEEYILPHSTLDTQFELVGGPRFLLPKKVMIHTPLSSSGCSIIDEFNGIQAQVNTNLYCYCYKPDIIINAAGGETFKYCRTCKKEKK